MLGHFTFIKKNHNNNKQIGIEDDLFILSAVITNTIA